MDIWFGLSRKPGLPQGAAVTIGNFDGVHLGHRHILQRLRQEADSRGLPALAAKMQVYTPTAAEIAKFRELAQPAVKAQIAKSFGAEGEALMKEFLAAVDKAAKN